MSSDSKTAFSCRKNTYIMAGIISELNYCREKKSVNLSTFRSTDNKLMFFNFISQINITLTVRRYLYQKPIPSFICLL